MHLLDHVGSEVESSDTGASDFMVMNPNSNISHMTLPPCQNRAEDTAREVAAEREASRREADRKLGTVARRAARQLKDAQKEAVRARDQAARDARQLQRSEPFTITKRVPWLHRRS